MFLILVGIPLAILIWAVAGRARSRHIGRLALVAGIVASTLAWLEIAFLVWGPSYSFESLSIGRDGSEQVTRGTQSLVQLGITPLAAGMIALDALCFLALLCGVTAVALGRRTGKWLALVAIVPVTVIGAISFGVASVIPAVVLGQLSVAMTFAAASRDPHPAADAPRG